MQQERELVNKEMRKEKGKKKEKNIKQLRNNKSNLSLSNIERKRGSKENDIKKRKEKKVEEEVMIESCNVYRGCNVNDDE